MAIDVTLSDPRIERARGVIAERFGVKISTASAILEQVAHAHKCSVDELAVAVVASCTDDTALPRSLYAVSPNGDAA